MEDKTKAIDVLNRNLGVQIRKVSEDSRTVEFELSNETRDAHVVNCFQNCNFRCC